ncbi:MAG: TonB-dependent receptor [Candidatus Acidiferrales bacterium]
MNTKHRISLVLSILFFAALATPTRTAAQTSQGQISGEVTDSSGAVVVKATVTIENEGTHAKRALETNAAGQYAALDLDPGFYSVQVEAAGFQSVVQHRVELEVARAIRVDFQLKPGNLAQAIEVRREAQLTDTTDTTLNGELPSDAVTQLPVLGRDFQNLLALHPGVQRTPGGGFHSVTSNGMRPDDNNFYIDGANDNDVYYGETVVNDAGISGTPASHLPLDAIQEFNTQEDPEADYGVKPGVVMNIGMKSGTNDIHGSLYYFHRNSAFDARNFFAPAPDPVPALLLHDFGASLGGPIRKDKWFYFVNYEGVRDKVGNPGNVDSPVTVSLASRAGLLPSGYVPADFSEVDAITGCQATSSCSPLSVNLSKFFYSNPGFTASASDPALIDYDFNNTNREDNVVAKTDYILNSHNTLSASFIYANTTEAEEDALPIAPEWLSTTSPTTQVFGVNWSWTPSAAWINQARFSYNRFNEAIFPVDHNVNPLTGYGIPTGVTDPRLFGMPRINPSDDLFNYMGGNSSWPLFTSPSQTENISDSLAYSSGKHVLKFGGEFRYGSVNYYRAGYGRGRVDFDSLEDFMSGNTAGIDQWRFLYGDPSRDISLTSFGMFIQDNYRIRPRVSLNLGLRYDVTYPIKDSRNLLANYVPSQGVVQVGDGISAPYQTNYNNVSPRVGVAWDVFGNAKTVVRAAGGLIFEQPSIRTFAFNGGGLNLNPTTAALGVTPGNGSINSFLVESTDSSLITWNQTGPIFPPSSGAQCSSALPCSIFGVNQHLQTPFIVDWNLNVQQALTPTTLLQVGYVANHGARLYSVQDINQPNPSLSAPCILATSGETGVNAIFDGDYSDCEQAARPLTTACPSPVGLGTGGGPCYPYMGILTYLANLSNSDYNSLQVTLTKKYSHGLYLLAGYTYAHAIDTATNNVAASAGVPQNSANYSGDRGNADFDIRHRFTLSATYAFPSVKTKWQLLEGWQFNTILTLEGGEPFTLGDFVDDESATGEFDDRWNISGPASAITWSASTPLNYIDPSTFTLDSNSNVIGGNQQCINAAGPNNQAALNMLGAYGCYVVKNTVLTPAALGTFGDSSRNMFRGPSFKNWDVSLSKMWNLTEKFHLQMRAEFFNVLNHPNFDVFTMNNDLSDPTTAGTVAFTPDVGESNPVMGSGGSRHIQLGLKLTW